MNGRRLDVDVLRRLGRHRVLGARMVVRMIAGMQLNFAVRTVAAMQLTSVWMMMLVMVAVVSSVCGRRRRLLQAVLQHRLAGRSAKRVGATVAGRPIRAYAVAAH